LIGFAPRPVDRRRESDQTEGKRAQPGGRCIAHAQRRRSAATARGERPVRPPSSRPAPATGRAEGAFSEPAEPVAKEPAAPVGIPGPCQSSRRMGRAWKGASWVRKPRDDCDRPPPFGRPRRVGLTESPARTGRAPNPSPIREAARPAHLVGRDRVPRLTGRQHGGCNTAFAVRHAKPPPRRSSPGDRFNAYANS
jgi:hypothetical protein